MDQPLIQLFDLCHTGQLRETLQAILTASLGTEAEVRLEVVKEFPREFEDAFFKRFEISKPHLILLLDTATWRNDSTQSLKATIGLRLLRRSQEREVYSVKS